MVLEREFARVEQRVEAIEATATSTYPDLQERRKVQELLEVP